MRKSIDVSFACWSYLAFIAASSWRNLTSVCLFFSISISRCFSIAANFKFNISSVSLRVTAICKLMAFNSACNDRWRIADNSFSNAFLSSNNIWSYLAFMADSSCFSLSTFWRFCSNSNWRCAFILSWRNDNILSVPAAVTDISNWIASITAFRSAMRCFFAASIAFFCSLLNSDVLWLVACSFVSFSICVKTTSAACRKATNVFCAVFAAICLSPSPNHFARKPVLVSAWYFVSLACFSQTFWKLSMYACAAFAPFFL